MCDTAVVFDRRSGVEQSYFAKNSDRDMEELQIIEVSMDPTREFKAFPYFERRQRYVNTNLPVLRQAFAEHAHPYQAVISRPIWMWGAEMGVNEHGVAIGNEAVFSTEPTPDEGLLGMDILRLALHNTASAKDAYRFIIHLLESYGQGGDGGYTSSLYYHNAFLIKDADEAFVLETAGRHWAVKRILDHAAISNTYSLRTDADQLDTGSAGVGDFKAVYEDRAASEPKNGEPRLAFSSQYVQQKDPDLTMMQNLLRSHGTPKASKSRARDALCIHPGGSSVTESTASMVVHWLPNVTLVWFSGTPQPCRALFKPLVLSKAAEFAFTDPKFAQDYAQTHRQLIRAVSSAPESVQEAVLTLRDEWEETYRARMYADIQSKSSEQLLAVSQECLQLEEQYQAQVRSLLNG